VNEKEAKRLENLRKRNREIYEHSGNFEPLEMIKSGKAKRYSSKREIATVIIAFIIVTAVISGIFGLTFVFFRVNNINVLNVTDFYADQVISASGIEKGENLLLLDKEKIKKNIASKIDYASDIQIKKIFPSTVNIDMKTGQAKYYVKAGNVYYVLNKDCVVIAQTKRIEDVELAGCILLQSGEMARCVLGEKLTYRDADLQGVFDELNEMFDKYGHTGFVTAIYLDSKFDIRFTYKGRYTVKLGDLFDLDIKFQFLEKIAETLSETDGGIIDISDDDIHEAIVTLY
jgi:cell division protein FtsQ